MQFLQKEEFIKNYYYKLTYAWKFINNNVCNQLHCVIKLIICSSVSDTHTQLGESTDMMKEILSLLNNSNPDNQGSEVILEAVLDWLQGSPRTILLSHCVHAATRNLASLTHMAQIVELCIQLAFVPGRNEQLCMFFYDTNI